MQTNNTENSKFLPVAVVVAGLLIAGAVVWNGSRTPTDPSLAGAAPAVDIQNVDTAGDPFIGKADAPLTIAAWGDFRCSFCKQFELTTLPQIITEYVDTGKVKIVFMDFAFLGDNSTTAALYGRSVWNLYPSAYHAWRTAVYKAQDEAGDPSFGDVASMDRLSATIAGIDAARVAADVKANESAYKAAIDADRTEGQKVGISATPSFVIGTQVIQGAYPYPNFKAAIDAALK